MEVKRDEYRGRLVDALMAYPRRRRELDAKLLRDVHAARRAGMTWEEIARPLGVTTQAAQKRWGPYPVDAPRVRSKRRTPAAPGGHGSASAS